MINYSVNQNNRTLLPPKYNWEELLESPTVGPKESAGFFLPANFKEGSIKGIKDNATEITYLVLDIDDIGETSKYITIRDTLFKKFADNEYYYYTSHSATKEKPKFRFIMPLKENIPVDFANGMSFYDKWGCFIEKFFPFSDKLVNPRFGGYFLPNIKTPDSFYEYRYNDGELFDHNKNNNYNNLYRSRIKTKIENDKKEKLKNSFNKTKRNKYSTDKVIDTWEKWIECNKSGCVKQWRDGHDSGIMTVPSGQAGGGREKLLFSVLLSAKCLEIDQCLIDDVRNEVLRYETMSFFERKYNKAMKNSTVTNPISIAATRGNAFTPSHKEIETVKSLLSKNENSLSDNERQQLINILNRYPNFNLDEYNEDNDDLFGGN